MRGGSDGMDRWMDQHPCQMQKRGRGGRMGVMNQGEKLMMGVMDQGGMGAIRIGTRSIVRSI